MGCRYNEAVPEDTGARIPVQGAAGPDTAALLIGNTKQIWEHFLTACSFHQVGGMQSLLTAFAICTTGG